MKAVCSLCPHGCVLAEGQLGRCGARKNQQGVISSMNYGRITGMGLDPIEKKPLSRYMPGSFVLSVGSFGCNLACPFCQNHEIVSGTRERNLPYLSPEELVQTAVDAVPSGNIGVAYTYNEPLVGYEYVWDTAKLIRRAGLKNVLVTNGYICQEPLQALLPWIDAMNIDLKSFRQSFYSKIGGDLQTVKDTIAQAVQCCHVEVTTLIIPGENDSEEEMRELSCWIGKIDSNIPLHLSRFFPRHLYGNRFATPTKTIDQLIQIAGENVKYVYPGNC